MIGPHDSRNFFCPGPFGFVQSSFQASEQPTRPVGSSGGVLLTRTLVLFPMLYITYPIAGLRNGYHYHILTSLGPRNDTLCSSTRSVGPCGP